MVCCHWEPGPEPPPDRITQTPDPSGVGAEKEGCFLDYMNAIAGTQIARSLIAPMEDLPKILRDRGFDLFRDTNVKQEEVTLMALRAGEFMERGFQMRCEYAADRHTDTQAMNDMDSAVTKLFEAVRKNLTAYAAREGKEALRQVYWGGFVREADDRGMGIRELLERMALEYGPNGRFNASHVHHAQARFQETEREVRESRNLTGLLILTLRGREEKLTAEWVEALNRMYSARILLKRQEVMFGRFGIYETRVLKPVDQLVKELTES